MISVIVPVYRAEVFLDKCVQSVLAQTYKDIELLLIDDGSPDRCPEMCDRWTTLDNRVKAIHKPNGGVSSARNKGLEIAQGEYIAFVDSDDTLTEDALEKLIKDIKSTKADATFGSFQFQYGDKLQPHSLRLSKGLYAFTDVLPDFIDDGTLSGFLLGSVCGGIYKSEIIKLNNLHFVEGLKNNEDGLFNFEFALVAKNFSVIDTPVYNYRQDEAPSKPNRMNENFGEKVFDLLDAKDWDKECFDYEEQKTKRKVTLAWWDILHFATDYPFFKSLSFIRKTLSTPQVRNGMKSMRPEKMNRYKMIIFYLMKYRLCVSFYCLLKFVIPVLRKRLAR